MTGPYFTVTLSGNDFAEASWLMVKRLWLRRWGWIVPLVGVLFGFLLMEAGRQLHPDLPPARARSLFIKGALFTFAFAALQLFILLRVILRAGRPLPTSTERQTIRYHLQPDGLAMTLCDYQTRFAWPVFRRVIEDDRWLLLCRGGLTFCAFPKSQLDAGTILALKRGIDHS